MPDPTPPDAGRPPEPTAADTAALLDANAAMAANVVHRRVFPYPQWAEAVHLARLYQARLAAAEQFDAALKRQAEAVASRLAAAEGLLAPFARYPDSRGDEMPDGTLMDEQSSLSPTLGDCRAARAFLEGKGDG